MSDETKVTPAAVGSDDGLAVDPLVGAMYRGCDGAWTCAKCNSEMEWEDCHAGCDDGYFDGYEDDPLWYQPGEMVRCHECGGEGGTWWCPDRECPTKEGWKRIEPPGSANK